MIAVFGSKGLLGSWLCALYPKEVIGFSREEVDITRSDQVQKALEDIRPDVVINAAGIVKSRDNAADFFKINAEGPRVIMNACDNLGIRMLQVSTDCVFKGDRGNYKETDTPDAEDAYGVSKMMGEIDRHPHLTVRMSFVGWPDMGDRGLIAWLAHQKDYSIVPGYVNSLWNGLTVWAAAKYLMELAYLPVYGIAHLHGQTVSKCDLLSAVTQLYEWRYKIEPVDQPVKNLTLFTSRSDLPYLPGTYNFEESVREMQKWAIKIFPL